MYQGARTLRIADCPDEVHRILIAKNVVKRYHSGQSWLLRQLGVVLESVGNASPIDRCGTSAFSSG
jgi:hypothetical protein